MSLPRAPRGTYRSAECRVRYRLETHCTGPAPAAVLSVSASRTPRHTSPGLSCWSSASGAISNSYSGNLPARFVFESRQQFRPFLPRNPQRCSQSQNMVHETATALQRGNNSSQIESTSCEIDALIASWYPRDRSRRDKYQMVSVISEDPTSPFQLRRAAKKRKGIANS